MLSSKEPWYSFLNQVPFTDQGIRVKTFAFWYRAQVANEGHISGTAADKEINIIKVLT